MCWNLILNQGSLSSVSKAQHQLFQRVERKVVTFLFVLAYCAVGTRLLDVLHVLHTWIVYCSVPCTELECSGDPCDRSKLKARTADGHT